AQALGELVGAVAARQLLLELVEIEVVAAIALAPHDVLDGGVIPGVAADEDRDGLADLEPGRTHHAPSTPLRRYCTVSTSVSCGSRAAKPSSLPAFAESIHQKCSAISTLIRSTGGSLPRQR